jgi:hypothetical protein
MGFSLVGNSGDTKQTTNNYDYTASLNPQLDFDGAGGGVLGLTVDPLAQGGSIGDIETDLNDYYAPVSITTTGDNLGDSALSSLSSLAAANAANQVTPAATASASMSSGISDDLSSLFSGNSIYYVLAAIVIFFLAEHK